MVIFRYKIIFILFFLSSNSVFASRQSKIDSLIRISEKSKQDTTRLNAWLEISGTVIFSSPDSALIFSNKALKLSRKIKNSKGEIQALNMLGNCYQRKGDYAKSLSYYNECKILAEKTNDLKGLAQTTNNIGIVYTNKGEYDKALQAYQESMEIERKRKNRNGEAEALNNIGVIHYYLGNMDKTIHYLKEAVAIEEELGNHQVLKKGYINLGALLDYTKDYKGALSYYEKALTLSKKLNDKQEMSICLNNIAGVYQNTKQYQKAEEIYLQAMKIKTEVGDKNGVALTNINLGTLAVLKGEIDKSIPYFLKALSISEEIDSKQNIKESCKNLASAYEQKGDYKTALIYQKKMDVIKDSILNEEKTKALAELETKFQTAEKERLLLLEKNKSAELEKQNAIKEKNVALEKKKTAEAEEASAKSKNLAIALGGGVIAITFLALFILQRNKRKAQAEKDAALITEREKGLKSIIETAENERRRIAKDLHDGVGQQLGGLKMAWQQLEKNLPQDEKSKIESLTGILNDTATEVRNISHQMMPKMLEQDGLQPALEDMFNKTLKLAGIKFEFTSQLKNERLNSNTELAVYRIAQEIIANILKHAQATEVIIDFYKRKDHYMLMIEDNGNGFDVKGTAAGLGLQNMKARAAAIQAQLNVESEKGKGASFILNIPF